MVGEELCPCKRCYKAGGVYSLFLAPKLKYCLTLDKFGIVQEHKTLKGFNYSTRLLDRCRIFKMIEGKKVSAMLQRVEKFV